MAKRLFIRNSQSIDETPTDGIFVRSINSKIVTQSPTLVNKIQFTYELGDYIPSEGGVVYHRYLESGLQNYLVIDTEDINPGITYSYSSITSTLIGSTAQSRWNGASNSVAIINQGAVSGAAYLCDTSTRNGKTDWYLPSIYEFHKIFNNYFFVSKGLDLAGGSQITSTIEYWTSTEISATVAFGYAATSGFNRQTALKSNLLRVRAVRKFII